MTESLPPAELPELETSQTETPSEPVETVPRDLAEIVRRIDDSAETTRAALVTVRAALEDVQEASRRHVSGMGAAAADIGGSGGATLDASFRRLETTLGTYLSSVEQEARLQTELADRAVHYCGEVLSAAHRIARIAALTRILSLNAAVKAAGVKNGAALNVVVRQITMFSDETEALAQSAIQAGNSLIERLPRVADLASSLLNRASSFSKEFHETVQKLGPESADLRRKVTEDLERSNEWLRGLANTSRRTLQALDFERQLRLGLDEMKTTANQLSALIERIPHPADPTTGPIANPQKTEAES